MLLLSIFSVLAATATLTTAAPVQSQSLEISALHEGLAALSKAIIDMQSSKEKRSFVEALETLEERQLVYQNAYGCGKRSVDGIWKRVPCLPEDALDAKAAKEKRQLVYQNAYGCRKRSVDGIWKRVPCLPEDSLDAKEKREPEAEAEAAAGPELMG